jgi:hypothetical protein
MANDVSALVPKIYAQGLSALRKRAVMPRYCLRYDPDFTAMGKGKTVDIPIPSQMGDAEDVIPGPTPPVTADITPNTAQITLNNWKKKGFTLTDQELTQIDRGFMPAQMSTAIDKIAKAIDTSILANYIHIYNYVGTAGTTPFATSTAEAQQARLRLNQAGAAEENRAIILDVNADANAAGLPIFQQYLQSGTTQTLETGRIGFRVGFEWDFDLYMPRHTNTGGTGFITSGVNALNATTLTVSTGTVAPAAGDIFTIAGDPQTYVVRAGATTTSWPISPGLQIAPPASSAITFRASHQISLAIQQECFGFASRPLADVEFKGGSEIMMVPDPKTGLVLRLEVSRQYKQTLFEFDCLWGTNIVRRECGVRIAG